MLKKNAEEIFIKYSNDVFHYALSLLKNYEEAKDARQEVFLKFIKSSESFRGDCNDKTWLLVITRNYCYRKLRDDNKANTSIEEISEISEMENLDKKISLSDAISRLNQEDSEIIYLREYAGHSYKEMSEILETSIDNVKVKLFRVRKKLRNYLK